MCEVGGAGQVQRGRERQVVTSQVLLQVGQEREAVTRQVLLQVGFEGQVARSSSEIVAHALQIDTGGQTTYSDDFFAYSFANAIGEYCYLCKARHTEKARTLHS